MKIIIALGMFLLLVSSGFHVKATNLSNQYVNPIDKYVQRTNKIIINLQNIDRYIDNEFTDEELNNIQESLNSSLDYGVNVKEYIRENLIQNFEEINKQIEDGKLRLLPSGRLISVDIVQGGKNTGSILYYWGWRRKLSTSSATKKIAKIRKGSKNDSKLKIVRDAMGLTSLPAGLANLAADYMVNQFKNGAKKMEKVNKSTKKGIVIDYNWILDSKVYKQK